MPESPADILFRDLTSKGPDAFAMVDDLIHKEAEENEWWEFKGSFQLDTPFFYTRTQAPDKATADKEKESQTTIKKYWSKSLSAFANAGGGLLIWGIDAPQRRAKSRSLAPNAGHLADRLKDLQNNAADPPVPGVEVLAVPKPNSQEGFVVCHIPHSDFSPHRAIFAGSAYYLRTGDSSQPMQTEVLRRMFYPHTFPRLVPVARLSVVLGDDRRLHINMQVDLKNFGSASARKTYVETETEGDRPFRAWCVDRFWKERQFTAAAGFESKVNIHPHEKIPLLANFSNQAGYEAIADLKTLSFTFRIFAQDAPPLLATLTFNQQELQDAAIERKPIDREAMSLFSSSPS